MYLIVAIFIEVLLLNCGTKEEGSVVYQIGRLFGEIQNQVIEAQSYNTNKIKIQIIESEGILIN